MIQVLKNTQLYEMGGTLKYPIWNSFKSAYLILGINQ